MKRNYNELAKQLANKYKDKYLTLETDKQFIKECTEKEIIIDDVKKLIERG